MDRLTVVAWSADLDRLVAFLERCAKAQVMARHPGFASLRIGSSAVEVHADESYRGHPWFDALKREGVARGVGAELRIAVDDVDVAYAAARQMGAAAVQPPADLGETYECVVMGPDGYLFSFWQPSRG